MTTWLEQRRAEARTVLDKTPLPTLRDENWRYTSLRGIDFDSFHTAALAEAGVPEGTLLRETAAGAWLAQRGQTIASVGVGEEVRSQGVTVMELERAANERPALVTPYLGTIVPLDDRFTAENAALWSGGALIHVPANVRVTLPLHVVCEIPESGARTIWRLLVVAEPGSKVTVIEEFVRGAPGYLNGVVELAIGEGATVDYIQAQNLHPETYHFTAQRAHLGRDAALNWASLAVGGKLGKSRMETKLNGPGSAVRVTGLYALDDQQHLDLDTTQEHAAPNSTSDLAYKGALLGRSRAVWRGIIKVDEGAQKTDAFQENRNLLLSSRAHADSIPGLEILANDVRCTHAATISQVDRELLFFLQSRGFDAADARRMLVRGFFEDALARIVDTRVRERFGQALSARVG